MNIQDALCRQVVSGAEGREQDGPYYDFIRCLDIQKLKKQIIEQLKHDGLSITVKSLTHLVDYIKAVFFRGSQGNILEADADEGWKIEGRFYLITDRVIAPTEEFYQFKIPGGDKQSLVKQFMMHTYANEISPEERSRLLVEIREILIRIDEQFLTDFSGDTGMEEALLLHVRFILKRVICLWEDRNA